MDKQYFLVTKEDDKYYLLCNEDKMEVLKIPKHNDVMRILSAFKNSNITILERR